MAVYTRYIDVGTRGSTDIIDITDECSRHLSDCGIMDGVMTVFNPGSTGGVTTLEYEPNLVKDLREALEIIAPAAGTYHHEKTWNDDNGSSHIRSSIMGPSLSVPFSGGKLILGTWQQIVFCDFDMTPRHRRLVVQIVGE